MKFLTAESRVRLPEIKISRFTKIQRYEGSDFKDRSIIDRPFIGLRDLLSFLALTCHDLPLSTSRVALP